MKWFRTLSLDERVASLIITYFLFEVMFSVTDLPYRAVGLLNIKWFQSLEWLGMYYILASTIVYAIRGRASFAQKFPVEDMFYSYAGIAIYFSITKWDIVWSYPSLRSYFLLVGGVYMVGSCWEALLAAFNVFFRQPTRDTSSPEP